jgi:hypothetical protein
LKAKAILQAADSYLASWETAPFLENIIMFTDATTSPYIDLTWSH